MKFVRYWILLIVMSASVFLTAQDQFDRIYKTDQRQMIALDAVTTENGEYFVLSKLIPEDPEMDSLGLNVTKLKHKGDVDWSMDYYFEDSLQVESFGGLIISPDGGLIVTGVLRDTAMRNDKIVMKISSSGAVDWANTYSGELQEMNQTSFALLGNLDNESFVFTGGQNDSEGLGVYTARINLDGELLWSQTLNIAGDPVREIVSEVLFTIDSSIVMVGTKGVSQSSIFLTKLDTTGQVLFSREYAIGDDPTISIGAFDVVELPDTSYVITGFHEDTETFVNSGLVFRVDSLGHLVWSKRVSFGDFVSRTVTNHVAVMENGMIAISGIYFNFAQINPREFLISILPNGVPNWQTQFPGTIGQVEFTRTGELMTTSNPGVAVVSTVVDSVMGSAGMDSTRLIPHLVKVDLDGSTSCEDSLSLDVFLDLQLSEDTLIWESVSFDSLAEIEVFTGTYGNFDVPILSLTDTIFCPGDPVMFDLDATVEGAVSYKWTTAEEPNNILSTDSIYTATELDVQYVATVRVEEDVCFTLCDTTTLADIDPPMVEIAPNFAEYCELRNILLFVQASGQIEMVEWSTGQTDVSPIAVQQIGTYSVTVTNQCGDTGEASITLNESDLPPADQVVIQKNDNNLCTTGEITLTVTAPPGLSDITWSTGANGPQISVAEPGTYTVTGIDDCMYEVTGEIVVTDSDFLDIVDIDLVADLDNCSNGQIGIDLLGVGEDVDVVTWSTGVTNVVRIIVSEPGTYSVMAVDICGGIYETSIDITLQQLIDCGRTVGEPCPDDETQCLCYPNIFRPQSDEELNRSFGPDNRCPEITDFEMRIYNRWGQLVFESSAVETEWDGKKDGEELQGDVYIYYVRYVADGVEFVSKGDVILLR